MASILIKKCNLISMDEWREIYETNIDILIKKGKIEKIGRNLNVPGAKVIDARGKYVLPGMINCHTHIPMSLFREIGDGHTLQEWLEKDIWPLEAKMSKEDCLYFSSLSMVESLRNGVTLLNDMYFGTDIIIKAAEKTGIDVIETVTLMDIDGEKKGIKRLENFINFCKKYPKGKKTVAIHGLYTASTEYIKECIHVGDRLNVNTYHIHFCENTQEVRTIKKMHKVKHPSDVLKNCFDPRKHNLILAHCVKLDSTDFRNLAILGANVAHNPLSNLKLGCGIADITKMKKMKITVGIGTDGQGSCGNLSVLENAKLAALLQRGDYENPTLIPAYEALQLATIEGAKCLGLEKTKGSITEGKDADLVIWNLDNIETHPINHVCGDIVYNANSSNVETVIVNGEIIILEKNNKRVDEEELIRICDRLAAKIKGKK